MNRITHGGQRDNAAGITLIEMLVSLVIFAFVGIASFTMLDTLLKTRAQTEGRLEVVAQIDRALTVFSHDFVQGAPALLRLEDGQLSLQLSPDQRHGYALDADALVRTVTSDFGSANPLTQMLVPDVRDLRFTVLDGSGTWHDSWPIEEAIPRAVRMKFVLGQEREVSRMVVLTDGVVP